MSASIGATILRVTASRLRASISVRGATLQSQGYDRVSIFNIYRPQVQAYRDSVEAEAEGWAKDHDDAIACRNVEQMIRLGVGLYDGLESADEKLRLDAARGKFVYTDEVDRAFGKLFRWWLDPCHLVEAEISALEAKSYTVELASAFRERCARARSVLAESAEQYSSPG